jgi:hypothetical protein
MTGHPIPAIRGDLLGRYVTALRAGVGGETKSYGFTLVVWGTGTSAMAQHGRPAQLDVASFLTGVFLAMALAILVTFGGPAAPVEHTQLNRYAAGAVHLASVVGGLAAARLVLSVVDPTALAYALAGFFGVLVYQLLLGVEVAASIRPPQPPPPVLDR